MGARRKEADRLMQTWRDQNPDWRYTLWDEDSLTSFFEANVPEALPVFRWLPSWAAKSDLARYYLVWYFGGIYADADTECLEPLDKWTWTDPQTKAVHTVQWDSWDWVLEYEFPPTVPYHDAVSIGACFPEQQLAQFFFATSAMNPAMRAVAEQCLTNVLVAMRTDPVQLRKMQDNQGMTWTLATTGPHVFTKTLTHWFARNRPTSQPFVFPHRSLAGSCFVHKEFGSWKTLFVKLGFNSHHPEWFVPTVLLLAIGMILATVSGRKFASNPGWTVSCVAILGMLALWG